MPTVFRRLRRVRRGATYTIAIALVLLALVLGAASQILPLAEQHPDRVAAWLSARAGRPISFDAVQTAWTRRGPLLQLQGLRVGEGGRAFVVGDAEMLVSIYAGLLPGVPLSELRVRGLELVLERTGDGTWQVRGLPGQREAGGDPFAALEDLGELQVIDAHLRVVSVASEVDASIPRVDLRLRVDGGRVRAGLRALQAPGPDGAYDGAIDAALQLERSSGDGRLWISAPSIDLQPWAALLAAAGVQVAGGHGRARIHAGLSGRRIAEVSVDAALGQLRLRASDRLAPDVTLESVSGVVRWRQEGTGWRLDAPRLRLVQGGREHEYDGLLLAGGSRPALLAGRLELSPLLQVAALSDRLRPAMRSWLAKARPEATLHAVELASGDGGRLRVRARVEGLAFDPVEDQPGLRGLAGELTGDEDGFAFRLDPARSMQFDWPAGFGVVHTASLDGTISGWRDGDGWSVGTGGLRVRGQDFGLSARGSLHWEPAGGLPWIELAATVDPTELPVARGFLVRHHMPEQLQQWLDMALQGGRLQGGRAVMAGDLDDWPFTGGAGRFEVRGRIEDAVLRFQPDWPAAERLDAELAFIDNGFEIQGSAELSGVRIGTVKAGMDRYSGGVLEVGAAGEGDVAALLRLLGQSPLRAQQPEVFDNLTGQGPASVGFRLRLPAGSGRLSIGGEVELEGAHLSAPNFGLAFDDVRGRAVYDGEGFIAEELVVRHEGRPGRLALRAGDGHVLDEDNLFEGALQAQVAAATLLDQADALEWLRPHVTGSSRWTASVLVPRPPRGERARPSLRLQSDLVGTTLSLPQPLRKAPAAALPATIETPLPLDGGEVSVTLGSRMALRARTRGSDTGIRIAVGSRRVDAPPARGLVVGGRTPVLDAMDWVGLVGGGDGGGTPALGRIDVRAGQLRLLGGSFPDTRLLVLPGSSGALRVRAEGAALQGELRLPASEGAAIAARFERAHWIRAGQDEAGGPAGPGGTGTTPGKDPAGAGGSPAQSLDPASIPPLVVVVDDLRIGGAALGSARLETRPTAAGLQVDTLEATGPRHRLDIDGSWVGQGADARTRLSASLSSGDMGALLQGTPLQGRLAGGSGGISLRADWPGTPAGFAAANARGELTIDVREGQLLEVEPGAGRVLGLLSIAELPRRLTLDFRDFFNRGLAFNEAGGTIRFGNGIARTDDLHINGPAADISIRGTADLRAERYDQTIEVLPSTGNLLTVAGALAGGPVGAAIGAAANAVLHKPMGQIGARTYHVTGPWSDPEVEVIRGDNGSPPGSPGE